MFRFGYPLSENQNPADYLVKSLGKISNNTENIQSLYSTFETTKSHSQMMKYIEIETEHDSISVSTFFLTLTYGFLKRNI